MIVTIYVPLETLSILKEADIREVLGSITSNPAKDITYMGSGKVHFYQCTGIIYGTALYFKIYAPLDKLINVQLPHNATLFIENRALY